MAYIALAVFKAAVFPAGTDDTLDDSRIQLALDAGAQLIDNYCDRAFGVVDGTILTPTTKTFEARSSNILSIPDIQSVSAVALDRDADRTYGTTLLTSDYDLWPYDGPPYSQIRLRGTTSYGFYAGLLVQVSGVWGYSSTTTVPAAVQQANLLLANRLLKRQEAPFGVLELPNIGEVARISSVDPDVQQLLAPYSRTRGAAWAIV